MEHTIDTGRKWKEVITEKHSVWKINAREIWDYRDLLVIWMRRDVLSIYKQTILGPVWFVLQPILTAIAYIAIFSRAAKFSTMNLPPVIFYLSGIIIWSYFSECVTKTATFFKDGQAIFSKVYFPRLIIPLSLVLTNLVKFGIQFLLFLVAWLFYRFTGNLLHPNASLLLLPVLILLVAALGLGSGLIIASLTTRYKDFVHLITFGIQLLMFASPVLFAPGALPKGSFLRTVIIANPVSGIIEAFRFGFTGSGLFSWPLLAYDTACIVTLLVLGVLLFNSVERDFVDNI